MKKFFGSLALVGIAGGAIALMQHASEAMPPPPLPVVKILCDGNNSCCAGIGPTNYFYRVQLPSGGAVQVTRIDIGTDNANINNYSGWIEPLGWTHQILAAPANQPDRLGCVPHGTVVSPTGNSQSIVRFSGPPQTSNFTLGFDIAQAAHEVTWKASTGNQADWTKAVGLGPGPVHGPSTAPPHQQGQHDM